MFTLGRIYAEKKHLRSTTFYPNGSNNTVGDEMANCTKKEGEKKNRNGEGNEQ